MTNPIVYLLVPVHNRRNITAQFAQNIKEQTYKNLRLILIDDGSSDGTAVAVREILPSVKILQGDGNLWWAGSLQKGLNYLRDIDADDESVVLMCNDDVVLDNTFVQTGVQLLSTNLNSLLLAQHRDSVDAPPRESGISFHNIKMSFDIATSPDQINCLATRGLFLTWKTAQRIGNFHTRILSHYGSDYEWTIRAEKLGIHLWTDPSVSLIPMLEETGHRSTGELTFTKLMTLYFSKRSTGNFVMRNVLYALIASRRHVPVVLARYWLTCARQIVFVLYRSILRLLRGGIYTVGKN